MRATWLVTAVLAAGSASFGFLPLAHAGTSTQVVTPAAEAWFQPNPTCGSPAGCVTTETLPAQPPAAPPTSPYPAGTLHVGAAAAQETARTYLGFSLSLVDQQVTAAALDVPLDVSQSDGSVSPETAKVVVCTFGGGVTPGTAGSVSAPPSAFCGVSAPATYVATPAPHLHADLGALSESLGAGAGLVLLPDAAQLAPTDAPWRVVFSAHDRSDPAKTPPPSLSLTLTDVQQDDQPPVVPPAAAPAVPPVSDGLAPALPETTVPQAPDVSAPQVAVPGAQVPQATTVRVGYAYPTVWLLPLAFLVLVPLTARTLTRDLTPVRG